MAYFQWIYCPECAGRLIQFSDGENVRPYCPKCRKHYYHNPPPVVALLAANSEGKLLAVKRAVEPAYGKWCLVCGFMELLETPEQAVLRELAEEAGLTGEVKRLVGVFYEESERLGSVIVLGYEVAVDGQPKPGSDALEAKFFDIGKLPPLAFQSQRKMLEIYRAGR